jgi:hypothetical protein
VRSGVVATHTDDSDFTATLTESRAVDGWFTNGVDQMDVRPECRALQSGACVDAINQPDPCLGRGTLAVAVSDTFEIVPGCDKTGGMCKTRFANKINFRGEDFLPGLAFLIGAGQ